MYVFPVSESITFTTDYGFKLHKTVKYSIDYGLLFIHVKPSSQKNLFSSK